MAYPISRSMNADLNEGATDGKYKKVIRDRGGVVTSQLNERRDLHDLYYGIHETPVKTSPDGLVHTTPNYVPTKPVEQFR